MNFNRRPLPQKDFPIVKIEDIHYFQKKEKALSIALVVVAVLAPVTFSLLMNRKFHWIFSAATGFAILMAALWMQFYRSRISRQLKHKYASLDIGAVLAKKNLARPQQPSRFVITNSGYSHYHLKCSKTGEKLLLARHRAHEDYEVAL